MQSQCRRKPSTLPRQPDSHDTATAENSPTTTNSSRFGKNNDAGQLFTASKAYKNGKKRTSSMPQKAPSAYRRATAPIAKIGTFSLHQPSSALALPARRQAADSPS
ncbi:MAG: hypothetical protein II491_01840, partial [Prevotella sp.]|nr:hypothetical protein [Prevotella sp.]